MSPGDEHVFRADIAARGAIRYQVARFTPGANPLGFAPTDARSLVAVETRLQVVELADPTPIAEAVFVHYQQAFGEESSLGPVENGIPTLVPVVDTVSFTEGVAVAFQPSGSRHVIVRVKVIIRARATGESAELVIAQTAADEWDGPATGLMSVDVSSPTYQVAVDPSGPCANLPPSDSDERNRL